MAQFVEQCPSCQQPIYLEDNVAGSCECLEGGLRQLLARQVRGRGGVVGRNTRPKIGMTRVASQAPQMIQTQPLPRPQARQLPELSPEMFLSNGALREVQAAVQTMGPRPPAAGDSRRVTAEQWRGGRVEMDLDLSMDGSIEAALNAGGREPESLTADLTSLWRRSVEADIDSEALQMEMSASDDIEFDRPPIPARGPLSDPRGSRFRVDRPTPEPEPFERRVVGEARHEVGQVRGQTIFSDRGLAYPLARNENRIVSQLSRPDDLTSTPSRRPAPMPAKVANARSEASRMAEHMRLPTAFEVLSRSDPFDDDF